MTAVKRTLGRLLPLGALAAAVAAGGLSSCTEINVAADHIAALEFDTLPFPSLVGGDTLRDSLGRAARLHAIAINGAGNVVEDSAIQYIALDTGVSIDANGYLVAQRKNGSVRLVANTSNLQSPIRTLTVARPPAVVIVPGKVVDTVTTDIAATNTSIALGVKLITADTVDNIGVTQGWLVSYQAFHNGAAIAPGDTSVAYVVDGARQTSLDTTFTDGTASRAIKVRPVAFTTLLDSVIVMATVRYRGADVRGSPVRFVILVRPKQASLSGSR
jgi:hypothetical protein